MQSEMYLLRGARKERPPVSGEHTIRDRRADKTRRKTDNTFRRGNHALRRPLQNNPLYKTPRSRDRSSDERPHLQKYESGEGHDGARRGSVQYKFPHARKRTQRQNNRNRGHAAAAHTGSQKPAGLRSRSADNQYHTFHKLRKTSRIREIHS